MGKIFMVSKLHMLESSAPIFSLGFKA